MSSKKSSATLSQALLPNQRKAAIAFYERALSNAAEKSPEHLKLARRWLARNDLFFLLTVLLKRRDLNHDWLFARCRELQDEPNGYLDLWAREHYKTTIITFGLSIQDILASHGEDPEPRFNGREVTIGILSFNRPAAKKPLRQIKYEFETNEELKALFPDVLWANPKSEAPKWSEDEGIIVRRASNPGEATVEAYGLVDGQPTGRHFLELIYDDTVTADSVTTPEMIAKTTSAWELSDNLSAEGGVKRFIGTCYHLFDTYTTMRERGIPARVYPCTSDGSEDFKKAVLRSPKFLAEKRRLQGPYTFGAQMLLNPKADTAQGFREEWLKYWPAKNTTGLNRYILVDPASKKKKGSDHTAMWVIGIDANENYYVIDGIRDRLNLTERWKALCQLHRTWRPRGVGYEEYGLQADIEHMQFMMDETNYRFTITPLAGKLSKEDRIKRLVPVAEQGRLFLPQHGIVRLDYEKKQVNIVRVFVQDEYLAFPVAAHDDMLDCLSRILDEDLGVMAPIADPEDMPKWMADLEGERDEGGWETH